METCINLRERYGQIYRINYEESRNAQYGPMARTQDPWLQQMLCKCGVIYPHGGDRLAASVDGHRRVASRLRRLSCVDIHQDGGFGELTVLFHVQEFAKIAEVMHPRRRRQVTPAERARLRRIGYQKAVESHSEMNVTPDKSDVPEEHRSPIALRQKTLF